MKPPAYMAELPGKVISLRLSRHRWDFPEISREGEGYGKGNEKRRKF